jgi:hypothetical protein
MMLGGLLKARQRSVLLREHCLSFVNANLAVESPQAAKVSVQSQVPSFFSMAIEVASFGL